MADKTTAEWVAWVLAGPIECLDDAKRDLTSALTAVRNQAIRECLVELDIVWHRTRTDEWGAWHLRQLQLMRDECRAALQKGITP